MKFFLTCPFGVGKSTILQNMVVQLKGKGYKIGDMSSPEIREAGTRVGFEIVDLLSCRRGILLHIGGSYGPSVEKYRVNLRSISQIGVTVLDNAVDKADVIIIDEVGSMELQGNNF